MEEPPFDTINQRISYLAHTVTDNPNAFAKLVKVTQSVIANIVGERKSKPSWETVEKIFAAIPNLNKDWFINGVGIPLSDSGKNEPASVNNFGKGHQAVGIHNSIVKQGGKGESEQTYRDLYFQCQGELSATKQMLNQMMGQK